MRRVVDAISCGDGSEYRAVLNELKLGDFCQLLFYWVCFVSYDRVCETVCRPQPVPVPLQDSAAELRAAGESIAAIVKKEEILNAVAKAAVSLDSETLQSAINGTPFASRCEIICRLIWSGGWYGSAVSSAIFGRRFSPELMPLRKRRISRWQPGNWRPASCIGRSRERRSKPERRRLSRDRYPVWSHPLLLASLRLGRRGDVLRVLYSRLPAPTYFVLHLHRRSGICDTDR